MRPSPPELVPLVCASCGRPLVAPPEADLFLCRPCGRVFEGDGAGLTEVPVATARPTSAHPPATGSEHLAVWRFVARPVVTAREVRGREDRGAAWETLRAAAEPAGPFLYAPAFVTQKLVVRAVGLGLTTAQPALTLDPGLPAPAVPLLPPLLGAGDAEAIAHFVFLALEAATSPGLQRIRYRLELSEPQLLMLPSCRDPRAVRDLGRRLLLADFDHLVA